MIRFRCWYCWRKYAVATEQIGSYRECAGCKRRMRVPRKHDGNSRVRSIADWIIELLLYGLGCGLLAFCLGLVIMAKAPFLVPVEGIFGLAGLTVIGVLVGVLFGEKALNWFKKRIRDHER